MFVLGFTGSKWLLLKDEFIGNDTCVISEYLIRFRSKVYSFY